MLANCSATNAEPAEGRPIAPGPEAVRVLSSGSPPRARLPAPMSTSSIASSAAKVACCSSLFLASDSILARSASSLSCMARRFAPPYGSIKQGKSLSFSFSSGLRQASLKTNWNGREVDFMIWSTKACMGSLRPVLAVGLGVGTEGCDANLFGSSSSIGATSSLPLHGSLGGASAACVSWGLGVARLVDWLLRLNLAAVGALAQLTFDGRAEPSVLPLRSSESMLPCRAIGCEDIE